LGYKGKLHSYKCDLTKENEIEAMFKWIEANHGGVDVCVNNAGFSSGEGIIGMSQYETLCILRVHSYILHHDDFTTYIMIYRLNC